MQEAQFLSKLAAGRYTWLGGYIVPRTSPRQKGNWRWITGGPVGVGFWHPGQPDGSGGIEARLRLWSTASHLPGQFDDAPSYERSIFICEWEF